MLMLPMIERCLLCIWLHNCHIHPRSPKNIRLQWALKLDQRGMKEGGLVWNIMFSFTLCGWSGVRAALTWKEMELECTMRRRQAGRDSVMLWAMFCLETVDPVIHADVSLTHTTYLNIFVSWQQYSLKASKMFRNSLKNESLKSWLDLQISIWQSNQTH